MTAPNSNITLKLADSIRSYLSFEPKPQQSDLVELLSEFMVKNDSEVFILSGYAGTGKSSMTSALVKALKDYKVHTELLAPTGRAAKVIGNYSNKSALTIHKKIYKRRVNSAGFSEFVLMPNIHVRTLFVVDEASMISDQSMGTGSFSSRTLLGDLMSYVRQGRRCKLLLIGDTAQLPPVGVDESPALNERVIASYGFNVSKVELTEVARQQDGSGILKNATTLRSRINKEEVIIPSLDLSLPDVKAVSGYDLQDELETAYGKYGSENVIVITRSNKRAMLFNQQIRARVFWFEDRLVIGDVLMIVKNNYFWSDSSEIGFIANGDFAEVIRIHRFFSKHGFNYAEITVQFIDYPSQPEMDVIILLDSLEEEHPSFPRDKHKMMWENILNEYAYEKNLGKRKKLAMNDPILNALVVKYAYAMTCHKSQGGQWPAVFIDHGYLTEEMMGNSFLRWLYTALTRAQEQVYLLNFHSSFLGDKE